MSDFVFAEKPSGFNTHQSHPWRLGFVEYLEKKLNQRFYIVSRLDQGTSGLLLLPTSVAAAEKMTALFEQKKVLKTYYFLTDHPSSQKKISTKSYIEKAKNSFKSFPDKEANAETEFEFVKKINKYFLWIARPLTGKSHQIRLHAQDVGMPILGDTEHGGTDFYRLCLHCQNLEFEWQGQTIKAEAKPPVWLEEAPVVQWIFEESLQKRQMLLEKDASCFRLVHRESEKFKLDIFGPQAWAYRYDATEMTEEEEFFWQNVHQKINKPLLVKTMVNRGQDPHAGKAWTYGKFQETWQGKENDINYEFRSNTGQSPGLFLDQRENRKWLAENSKDKKVLNLFAYTGGFSVVAAKNGATSVATVDVSKNFLDWTKKNFELNSLSSEKHEFWESDVMFFLKAAIKKARSWDLIVCDPPSFGRSKEGVFKIDKDLPKLIELSCTALTPKGKILFSTNYEQWSMHELHKILSELPCLRGWKINPAPGPGWDFELSEDPVMKSFILNR